MRMSVQMSWESHAENQDTVSQVVETHSVLGLQ